MAATSSNAKNLPASAGYGTREPDTEAQKLLTESQQDHSDAREYENEDWTPRDIYLVSIVAASQQVAQCTAVILAVRCADVGFEEGIARSLPLPWLIHFLCFLNGLCCLASNTLEHVDRRKTTVLLGCGLNLACAAVARLSLGSHPMSFLICHCVLSFGQILFGHIGSTLLGRLDYRYDRQGAFKRYVILMAALASTCSLTVTFLYASRYATGIVNPQDVFVGFAFASGCLGVLMAAWVPSSRPIRLEKLTELERPRLL